MARQQFGGTFAPPLTDEKLAEYKAMIDALPADSQVKDVCGKLYACTLQWWELPESVDTATRKHQSGRGVITELDADVQKKLWDAIPWDYELQVYAKVLEGISNETDKPLRDAAHHLLWHVCELNLDREPLTADKL